MRLAKPHFPYENGHVVFPRAKFAKVFTRSVRTTEKCCKRRMAVIRLGIGTSPTTQQTPQAVKILRFAPSHALPYYITARSPVSPVVKAASPTPSVTQTQGALKRWLDRIARACCKQPE